MGGAGKGGKGVSEGKGGKGGKGGRGHPPPATAAHSTAAESLAAASAGFVKAIADNATAFSVFDHEQVDGQICVNVRDLARRLNAQGWKDV